MCSEDPDHSTTVRSTVSGTINWRFEEFKLYWEEQKNKAEKRMEIPAWLKQKYVDAGAEAA